MKYAISFLIFSLPLTACGQSPTADPASTGGDTNDVLPAVVVVAEHDHGASCSPKAREAGDVLENVVGLEHKVEIVVIRQQETKQSVEELLALVRDAFPNLAERLDDGSLDTRWAASEGTCQCPEDELLVFTLMCECPSEVAVETSEPEGLSSKAIH